MYLHDDEGHKNRKIKAQVRAYASGADKYQTASRVFFWSRGPSLVHPAPSGPDPGSIENGAAIISLLKRVS